MARVLSAGMMLLIAVEFCAVAIWAGVIPVLSGACALGAAVAAGLADAGLEGPVGPPGARTMPGVAAWVVTGAEAGAAGVVVGAPVEALELPDEPLPVIEPSNELSVLSELVPPIILKSAACSE